MFKNIESTPVIVSVNKQDLFEHNLQKLKSCSLQDILEGKALTTIETCLEFAQSVFPSEQQEIYRKIAYHFFNNSNVPRKYLLENRHLDILRVLIYTKNLDQAIIKAVYAKVYKDLKEILAEPKSANSETATLDCKPYINSQKLTEVVVSFGTGVNFFAEIREDNHSGYALESQPLKGIFVSPHDGIQSLEELDQRTQFYATRTPFKHFDKPVGVTFKFPTSKLHCIHLEHEAVILTEDLRNISKIVKMRFYNFDSYLKNLPAYFDMPVFHTDLNKCYTPEIAQKILAIIKSTDPTNHPSESKTSILSRRPEL